MLKIKGRGRLDEHKQDGLNILEFLVENRLEFCLSKMQSVVMNQEVRRLKLELLSPDLQENAGEENKEKGKLLTALKFYFCILATQKFKQTTLSFYVHSMCMCNMCLL